MLHVGYTTCIEYTVGMKNLFRMSFSFRFWHLELDWMKEFTYKEVLVEDVMVINKCDREM